MDPTPDSNTGRYNVVILYDFLAGGSGHLAELSHRDNPKRACDWIERTIKILTVEGDMSEEVRRREVIRRLLTSACNDALLDPKRALEFLQGAVAGVLPLPPPPVNADAWTVERLAGENPPAEFNLYLPEGLVTGVPGGCHSFSRYTPEDGHPPHNALVVLRRAGAQPVIQIGRWFHQTMNDPELPHRLRLRPGPSMDLTESEFNAIPAQIVAIQTPVR
jgi:hypothetical protein